MSYITRLPVIALLLALALPALAAEPFLTLPDAVFVPPSQPAQPAPDTVAPQTDVPLYLDQALAREHERFTQFALEQMQRMNATIIGGKQSMQVQKDDRGLYRASYKNIDVNSLVCQVRRAESNPSYFVGTVLYKEQFLENVALSSEACRKGPFKLSSEKTSRIIYSSKRGGGWQ